jgi:hypothetical protein
MELTQSDLIEDLTRLLISVGSIHSQQFEGQSYIPEHFSPGE